MNATSFWVYCALSLTVALTPGASWLYVMTARVRDGASGAAAAIAGNATGILCHTLLAAVGLTAALRFSSTAFTGVKIAGALYLAWLGIDTIRAGRSRMSVDDGQEPRSLSRIWRGGVLMNLLNPKAALLLIAVLPQFVAAGSERALLQFGLLGAVHAIIASVILAGVAVLTGMADRRVNLTPDQARMLRWFTGTIMFGFAVALLLSTQ